MGYRGLKVRLNLSRIWLTCDLNLRSADITTPRCLWFSRIGTVTPSKVRTGTFGACLWVKVCCEVFDALNVMIQLLP